MDAVRLQMGAIRFDACNTHELMRLYMDSTVQSLTLNDIVSMWEFETPSQCII